MKLTEQDFINEPDIRKRRKMFLDDTVQHYHKGNRATLFVSGTEACIYSPTPNSLGCAVGRWSPALHDHDNIISDPINGTDGPNYLTICPEWLQQMGLTFVRSVQRLHDERKNWTDAGLSVIGSHAVAEIQKHLV